MADPTALTQPQAILQAALNLGDPFHETDLAIAAWRLTPQAFGMRTKEAEFPDLNRVRAAMSHKRGPLDRGHMVRVAPLVYSLTPAGRREAAAVAAGERAETRRVERPRWPADLDAEVCRLLGTLAYRRHQDGADVPADAMWAFYDCETGDGDKALTLAQECVALALRDAAEYVQAGLPLGCGRVVKAEELAALRACDAHLAARLARRRGMRRVG